MKKTAFIWDDNESYSESDNNSLFKLTVDRFYDGNIAIYVCEVETVNELFDCEKDFKSLNMAKKWCEKTANSIFRKYK